MYACIYESVGVSVSGIGRFSVVVYFRESVFGVDDEKTGFSATACLEGYGIRDVSFGVGEFEGEYHLRRRLVFS
jgi:hypothetical protein